MPTAFISYDRADAARARRMVEALETAGLSVWWDLHLLAGERFDQRIARALAEADCVVVLWSSTSIASDWVKDEAAEGAARGVLVPVRIDDVEIPLGFRQLHTATITDWETPDFQEVLRSVHAVVDGTSRPRSGVDAVVLDAAAPRQRADAVGIMGARAEDRAARWRWWLVGAAAVVVMAGVFAWRPPSEPGTTRAEIDANAANPGAAASAVANTGAAGQGAVGDGPARAGTFDFRWPGLDCWDVRRGDKTVVARCGAATVALPAGRYRIQPQYRPFDAFDITITPGLTNVVAMGGQLHFTPPGLDCWEVLREQAPINIARCGEGTIALQAGAYTIRGQYGATFEQFNIEVRDGQTLTIPRK